MEERLSFTWLLMLFRYTCEFNITQYGEDSMTDLTQYSEKVEGKIIFQTLDTFMFSCLGEARVSEGYPQPWLHCSLREQGPFLIPDIVTTIIINANNTNNMMLTMNWKVSPELPLTQEEAMRFQEENLAAAVRISVDIILFLMTPNMMTIVTILMI